MSLRFDPSNPFPLIENLGIDYETEKVHAAHADAWLGIRTEETEVEIARQYTANGGAIGAVDKDREFWIGKSVQTFSTPYTELRTIVEELKPRGGSVICDLGAGYGRLAHVLARHVPDVSFVGIEIVEERQREGQRAIERANLAHARLVCGDVTKIDFAADAENADSFFVYDFGSRTDVETAIENLKALARIRSLTVVARGGRSRDVIEKRHPWLSQVVTPVHHRHYSIYRSS